MLLTSFGPIAVIALQKGLLINGSQQFCTRKLNEFVFQCQNTGFSFPTVELVFFASLPSP
jgi:hypothetical protein